MIMECFLLYYVFIMIISIFLFKLWIKLTRLFKFALDDPFRSKKNHSIHRKTTPSSGGVVIYLIFLLGSLLLYCLCHHEINKINKFSDVITLLATGFPLVVIGVADDLHNIRARYKFAMEFLLGIIVVNFFDIQYVNFGFFFIESRLISFFIAVFFFMGVINSINFIDGIDGLAGGISIVGFLLLAYIFFKNGDSIGMVASMTIILILFVFLIYNFHPAKIFMGDSGSMIIGGWFAILGLKATVNNSVFQIYPLLIVLFIPILDVSWAIVRRIKNRRNIFYPDKEHLHHQLLRRGLSIKITVIILWSVSGFMAIIAGLSYKLQDQYILLFFLLLFAAWILSGKIVGWI